MTAYLNEDEQVEALKNWWRDNGRSVVVGVVLGFAIIFGWQGWKAWQKSQGEAASSLFENLLIQVANGNREGALVAGKRLLGEFDGSIYASFAAFEMARLAYEDAKPDSAVGDLEWVEAHAPDAVIADLARVRLARVLLDAGKLDQAEARLKKVSEGFMPAAVAELEGDLAVRRGDPAAARQAYGRAVLAAPNNALLRMKLQQLGKGDKSA
ncbi:MAG: hypothetical protein D6720_12040 [Gammaproteobacteria bacterium]|nr:MAG: hypothetical protein D6720_12040 [Gammaproteobacteria bacterium]